MLRLYKRCLLGYVTGICLSMRTVFNTCPEEHYCVHRPEETEISSESSESFNVRPWPFHVQLMFDLFKLFGCEHFWVTSFPKVEHTHSGHCKRSDLRSLGLLGRLLADPK